MTAITLETAADIAAREALLDAAFGPARFRKTCERLREGRLPAAGLAFAAHDGARLTGTLRFWHVDAGGRPALMLGPLAVAHDQRSQGLGGQLMRHGLDEARRLGHGGVILVGDAPYYTRFGFVGAPVARLTLPGPFERARFLGLELRPGGLAGARGRVAATGARIEVAAALAA